MGNAAKKVQHIKLAPQDGPQKEFMSSEADIVIYGGHAGGGKLLKLNTILPTSNGNSTMGEIDIGDQVFDEKGEPCSVIAKSDVVYDYCYEIIFSDGNKIIAHKDHEWLTSTLRQRERARKCTDEWREKRRLNRPSKAKGNKSEAFVKSISTRNAASAKPLDKPFSGIHTTQEIFETLHINGRVNHSIDVCRSLQLPETELQIDPYVLGAWLGDGTSTAGQITGIDKEIFENIANHYEVTQHKVQKSKGILGLCTDLKYIGVFGNKHIPITYLRASHNQRLALLQGLMDTDGHVNDRGQCEICLTRKQLIDDVHELVASLGIKSKIVESYASLNGKHMGPKYTIKFLTELPAFRLPRKLIMQKRSGFRGTHNKRYIVDVQEIGQEYMQCIEVDSPSHLYLCSKQMIPTHNSYALLLEPTRHINKKGFGAVIFRRKLTQVTNEGGLWDEAMGIYPLLGGRKRGEPQLDFKFPSGTSIGFAHLILEETVFDWHSAQIALLCCEENTPVLLHDGQKKPLKKIEVGDYVQTLKGPKKVTAVGNRRLKDCVKAEIEGVGSQIQSYNHELLTDSGWISYDKLRESPLSSISSSRGCRFFHKSAGQFDKRYQSPSQPLDTPSCRCELHRESSGLQPGHQFSSDACVDKVGINQESDFSMSGCGIQEGGPPCLRFRFPVVLHSPQWHSKDICQSRQLVSAPDVLPDAQSGCKQEDYLDRYQICPHSCDEQFRQEEDSDQDVVPLSTDAEGQIRKDSPSDDPGKAQRCIHHKLRYDHPYTGASLRAEEDTVLGSCRFTPVGKKWVIDITVEDENHYITGTGLVNKNCFDELTQFSRKQFFYMMTRNRSVSGVRPYVRATCNPDADSWVAEFISWWWNPETGYVIPERSGVIRWMIKIDEAIHWFASREQAIKWRIDEGLDEAVKPLSVTFIEAKLEDNPALMEKDPDYKTKLHQQDRVTKERLIGGNWKIRATGGALFQRGDFEIVDEYPRNWVKAVRYWDFAGTEAKRSRSRSKMAERLINNPDYTVGLLGVIDRDQTIFIINMQRGRMSPGKVEKMVRETANGDGKRVHIFLEEEPGSSGKFVTHHYRKKVLLGFTVKSDRPTGSKLSRAEPYQAYAEAGNIKLLRAPWNAVFLDEHDAFIDENVHDDTVDSGSGMFKALTEKPPSTTEMMAKRGR